MTVGVGEESKARRGRTAAGSDAGNATVLPHLIANRAREYGERIFLRDVDGRSRTYAQLHEAAMHWAAVIRRFTSPGQRVLTLLPTSIESYEIWLGTSWAETFEVPINVAFRGKMLHYLISNSKSPLLIVHSRFLGNLLSITPVETLENIVIVDQPVANPLPPYKCHAFADFPKTNIEPAKSLQFNAWDVCLILYTSGTTGLSKGVLMPWGQLEDFAYNWLPLHTGDIGENDVFYTAAPMAHTAGRLPIYTMALINGEVVIREFFSPTNFWDDVRRFKCTCAFLLGGTAAMLHGFPPSDADAKTPLRYVGMVPLFSEVEQFKQRFAVKVSTLFAQTEISIAICSDGWNLRDNKSCGRVRPGFEVRVVDEFDRPVGPGEVGELVVRPSAPWRSMLGYLDNPQKTVEAWRNLWLHTGDAFTYDVEGNFYFVDRLKDAIRRKGENISSFEVEAEVLAHKAVMLCAAVPVSSELAEDEVMIFVQPKVGMNIDPRELFDFLLPRMPYFMAPRYIEVVESLPMTETAKIIKSELRARGATATTWDRVKAGIKLTRSS